MKKIKWTGIAATAFVLKEGEKKTVVKPGETVSIEPKMLERLSAYGNKIEVLGKTMENKMEKAVVKPEAVKKSQVTKTK